MSGNRIALACLIAIACALAPARNSYADWQNPVGVCKDSRGCGSDSGSVGGTTSSSGGGSFRWGHAISDNLADTKRTCRDEAFCTLLGGGMSVIWGAIFDGPYYAVKGVGYGLLYGGKGLYYGARGLGKGVGYTGRAIGRGLAYPFNRPPKPILPPTTWEQYKYDVLRHQKRLAKANKANKENQRWCVKNVPLEISPNRARWEDLCNPGDAVSRAALPHTLTTASAIPVEAIAVAAIPTTDPPTVTALPPTATPAAPAEKAQETSSDRQTSLPEKTDVAGAIEPLTSEPTTSEPVATTVQPISSDASATPQAPVAAQQAIQTGVAPEKSGLVTTAAGTAPAPPAQGATRRTLPSATQANVLTPSEYGFEGRGGYAVRYNHIWGKHPRPIFSSRNGISCNRCHPFRLPSGIRCTTRAPSMQK